MIRRREFIARLGGAAAWPLAARAQQPAMPVVGILSSVSPAFYKFVVPAIHRGLNDAGYVEGKNVTIEYRSADGQYDRLPALAADLVRRQAAAIITGPGGIPAALAAKAVTSTIPIVFAVADDPVRLGLVASLNRPGGNVTGVSTFAAELGAKGLGLLHELAPRATTVGVLVNPGNANSGTQIANAQAAARAIGLQFVALNAATESDIQATFETLIRQRNVALVIGTDAFLFSRRDQLIALSKRHAVPTLYARREFPDAGGLMSYGSSETEAYRQVGGYVGRILKGEKPADLPVVRSTKFELIINLKTAKALGLTVPRTLLALTDEVIE